MHCSPSSQRMIGMGRCKTGGPVRSTMPRCSASGGSRSAARRRQAIRQTVKPPCAHERLSTTGRWRRPLVALRPRCLTRKPANLCPPCKGFPGRRSDVRLSTPWGAHPTPGFTGPTPFSADQRRSLTRRTIAGGDLAGSLRAPDRGACTVHGRRFHPRQ